MKTPLDLLQEALQPKAISACVADLIASQTRAKRSFGEKDFVYSIRELEILRRLVARGLVRVLP